MAIEKSAGAVVFYRGDLGHRGRHIEYLLLLSTYWGFPKGQVEPGEDGRATARREIREETGLEVTLIDGFRYVDDFWYQHAGKRIHKQVIYFLAEAHQRDAKISYEHADIAWLAFDEALARLKYAGLRDILTQANAFLLKKPET